MKYETTPSFRGDYARLTPREKAAFAAAVREFSPACDRLVQDNVRFPATLRVKAVQGCAGVWEMTWSFSGPDGRATFEWVDINGERGVRWRRIGGHEIFRDP